MSLFPQKPKKIARLNDARKRLPKSKRMFFVALLAVVTLHFQSQLLETASGHEARGGEPGLSFIR